jgi:hypothetical protein
MQSLPTPTCGAGHNDVFVELADQISKDDCAFDGPDLYDASA